jgi:hypothetical protein
MNNLKYILISLFVTINIAQAMQQPVMGARTRKKPNIEHAMVEKPLPSQLAHMIVNIRTKNIPGFTGGWLNQYEVDLSNKGKINVAKNFSGAYSGTYTFLDNAVNLSPKEAREYFEVIEKYGKK